MAADMFMPRAKGPQPRYSVSTGLSGTGSAADGAVNGNGKKKNTARGGPPLGVATAGGSASGQGAAGAWKSSNGVNGVNGNQQASPILPSHLMNGQLQQNGSPQQSYLMLLPLNGTFERKQILLPYYPESLRIGRQTNAKTIPTPANGYFDSKVLSRQHAEVWAEKSTGRVWIRDIKSSNGTFVNGQRLSQENQDSEPHELRAEDVLELGIDIVGEDNKTIVHHKVAARVEHAGLYGGNNGSLDMGFGEMDAIGGGGSAASPLQHGSAQNSLRGRASSQGARAPAANGATGISHRQAPMMLMPINMEMVVKKLNFELQAAKQQSHDLQKTAEIFDLVLSTKPDKPDALPNGVDTKPQPAEDGPFQNTASESKSIFAPLPPQPTTELSRPGSAVDAASLKSNKSTKSDKPPPPLQMLSLVDALAKARKEVEAKSARVNDLEDALKKERMAREIAEDRAAQLENASRALRGKSRERLLDLDKEKKVEEVASQTDDVEEESTDEENSDGELRNGKNFPKISVQSALATADAASRHQRRLEEMILELQAAKENIDAYKQRAEIAEKESESNRKTLAEMIQKIRDEDLSKQQRVREHGCQTDTVATHSFGIQVDSEEPRETKQVTIETKDAVIMSEATSPPYKSGTRGRAEGALMLSRTTDAAPYASVLGVMIFGVGLMALLNGWQKGER